MTEEKYISVNDIVKVIHANKNIKNIYAKPVSRRIIKEYFHLASKAMLDGYEWEFPYGFGSAAIYKNALKDGQLPNASKVESLKNGYKTLSYNPKTVGFYYTIEMRSPVLEKTGMTFKANPTLRRKLWNRLSKTNKDYRKNEHKGKSISISGN